MSCKGIRKFFYQLRLSYIITKPVDWGKFPYGITYNLREIANY